MPLYNFECTECGHTFEDIQKADITEIPCEKCQKKSKRIMISVPQSPKMGLTNADVRIRDKMKRAPKSAAPSAMFDDGKGHRF